MTKREAIEILMQAAVRDIVGAGKGIRTNSEEWRDKVKKAIRVMWKHNRGREMDKIDEFNMGL